jgi:hypothetical protein
VTNGYYTRNQETVDILINTTIWYTFSEDIDYDGDYTDRVHVSANGANLEFDFSGAGLYNYSIPSIAGASTTPVLLDVAKENINPTNATYGKIYLNGTATVNDSVPAGTIIVYPHKEGEGMFTVEYLQQGTNHIPGNLQKGDLIKLCYEAPQDIGEDVEVRLNFIPKIGTATLTDFVTPDVISTERVYLYP